MYRLRRCFHERKLDLVVPYRLLLPARHTISTLRRRVTANKPIQIASSSRAHSRVNILVRRLCLGFILVPKLLSQRAHVRRGNFLVTCVLLTVRELFVFFKRISKLFNCNLFTMPCYTRTTSTQVKPATRQAVHTPLPRLQASWSKTLNHDET